MGEGLLLEMVWEYERRRYLRVDLPRVNRVLEWNRLPLQEAPARSARATLSRWAAARQRSRSMYPGAA